MARKRWCVIFLPLLAMFTSFTLKPTAFRYHTTINPSRLLLFAARASVATGSYLVGIYFRVPSSTLSTTAFKLPLIGVAELEPRDILDTCSCPLHHVLVDEVFLDNNAIGPSMDSIGEHQITIPGPAVSFSADAPPAPAAAKRAIPRYRRSSPARNYSTSPSRLS